MNHTPDYPPSELIRELIDLQGGTFRPEQVHCLECTERAVAKARRKPRPSITQSGSGSILLRKT